MKQTMKDIDKLSNWDLCNNFITYMWYVGFNNNLKGRYSLEQFKEVDGNCNAMLDELLKRMKGYKVKQ